jgi:hypothetical protein
MIAKQEGSGRALVARVSDSSSVDSQPDRDWAALDAQLRANLGAFSAANPNYWSYLGRDKRAFTHSYFQYPAMMVPAMQGDLLDAVLGLGLGNTSVLDPFVGSGTVMTETMLRGLNFGGQDINPLAVLLCRAKAGPFDTIQLRAVLDLLYLRLSRRRGAARVRDFPNRDKWFAPGVAADLSNLHDGIERAEKLWCRRFLWIALAETVRLVSNSRTSTVKLHIRPEADVRRRDELDVYDTFFTIAESNLERFAEYRHELANRDRLHGAEFVGRVAIGLGDSATGITVLGPNHKYDLLLTSPPYGDNLSTIAYGQQAYLPLQWIPRADIDDKLDETSIRTTQEIDRRSLGGRLKFDADAEGSAALKGCAALNDTIAAVASEPPDRARRVLAFCRDLAATLPHILAAMNPNSYMFWTVGNRRVGGRQVPLDAILESLLVFHGCVSVETVTRSIPASSKRMASRNQITSTMATESILVFRTPA